MSNKEKVKALEMAISQIEKNFGKGSIMRLGEEKTVEGVKAIPTGSLSLDIATGIGGLPRGRVVEIYGPESSGKTTLALNAVAQAQVATAGEVATGTRVIDRFTRVRTGIGQSDVVKAHVTAAGGSQV